METTETESQLVLNIANPGMVTVPLVCEMFGDNDKVIQSLKLKITIEKTEQEEWDREAEEADASVNEKGSHIMMRRKIKNIVGLPLADKTTGQAQPFSEAAWALVFKHAWIYDNLWATLLAVNQGKRSDTYRRMLLKN